MVVAYLQVSGVHGNSTDAAHPKWIELFKIEVKSDSTSRPPAGAGTSWVRPISVHAWSILGPHALDLHVARDSGQGFGSAVLEVMKSVNDTPIVKQRLRMTAVHVISYQRIRDPGLVKPIAKFVLVPADYSYEVGSRLLMTLAHEQAHAAG